MSNCDRDIDQVEADIIDDLPELTPEEADIIERQIDALYEGPEFQQRLEAYYARAEDKSG